jgi:hypothetical protein
MEGGRRKGVRAGGDGESERERERALGTRAGEKREATEKKRAGVLPRTPLAGYYFFYS